MKINLYSMKFYRDFSFDKVQIVKLESFFKDSSGGYGKYTIELNLQEFKQIDIEKIREINNYGFLFDSYNELIDFINSGRLKYRLLKDDMV